MFKPLLSFAILGAASFGFSFNIITNGDFEASPADTAWTIGGFALIDDFSGDIVSSMGDLGPPTNTTWLGGYDDAFDSITQSVTTVAGATSATLSFDWAFTDEDFPDFDFFTVTFGGTELYSGSIGGSFSGELSDFATMNFDVLAMMDGSAKDLVFDVVTDGSLPSSVFIDNVSLNVVAVPEPASMAVLGIGALALLRRRKKA